MAGHRPCNSTKVGASQLVESLRLNTAALVAPMWDPAVPKSTIAGDYRWQGQVFESADWNQNPSDGLSARSVAPLCPSR